MKCEMTFNYASFIYFFYTKNEEEAQKELNERKEKSDHVGM